MVGYNYAAKMNWEFAMMGTKHFLSSNLNKDTKQSKKRKKEKESNST